MPYPKSEDKKIQKLSKVLIRYVESQGVEFSFGGQELYAMEAFSDFGGLSLFLAEAKENYEKIYNHLYTVEELFETMGKKTKKLSLDEMIKEQNYLDSLPKEKIFPIEFIEKSEDTYFGFVPRVSQVLPPDFSMLTHFSVHAVEEYLKIYKKNKLLLIEGKIPLDPLYDKMVTRINTQKMKVFKTQPRSIQEALDMNRGVSPSAGMSDN